MDAEKQQTKEKKNFYITKTCLIITILILTSCFLITELIIGLLTKSNAILADSFHIFGDLITLLISLMTIRLSKREMSNTNTFGWIRAEILGSLINSVFLLALCFTILIDSINRFRDPEPLEKIDLIILIGVGRLFLNIISMSLFLIRSYRQKSSEKEMSMNLKVILLNALGDSLGSIAVILSGFLIKYIPDGSEIQWKLYIDPVLSLLIAIIIMINMVPILKKSSLILLQSVPLDFNVNELKVQILNVQGVSSVSHFYIWALNSEINVASVQIVIQDDSTDHLEIVQSVKNLLKENLIQISTIEIEFKSQK
ncbi:unnamed protein product [Brachionus calyciflorus]|uniref:Cation efflux protein transmembrane domain-containing protein n=1 Tax=Brachionus calyciflorus TaxID=104777 RepID=A0A813PHK6_9BILA|nr:unnamed protein product [Brachionus calyciflorus]